MKQTILLTGLLVFISLLTGCGQQTAEEKLLGHWEKIVAILQENKTDIAKASQAAKEYISANIGQMKELTGQFSRDAGKKIAAEQNFIMRMKKVRESVLELEKKYPVLLAHPSVMEALSPLGEITY